MCGLDKKQWQFFPGQTLSWLDALADVDMMQTESEGQDGICCVGYGEGSQARPWQASTLTACGNAAQRNTRPRVLWCLPFHTWEYHWLVMARLPGGKMAGSIPPTPALCTRSSSLTLRTLSHSLLLPEPSHLGGCDPPRVSLPEIRHL